MKNNKLVFFILLALISFSLDKYLNECSDEKVLINIMHFLHHTGAGYLYFGSLFFGNYELHLFIIFLVSIGWITNDNRCIISDIYNKSCGYDLETPLRDITYYTRKNFDISVYSLIGIIVLYDLFMIYKKK
tara:strand:+ start:549 stop:941 length:393 start_codon:yes stop_codon:yes gene_type:complete